VAVLNFENKTTSPDQQQELLEQMRVELRKRLGVRDAPEAQANALVTGTIQSFQLDMPVGISADPTQVSTRRRLQIIVDVQIVKDDRRVIYEKRGVTGTADYAERGEPDARRKAIDMLVSEIVTGVQGSWDRADDAASIQRPVVHGASAPR
jgi:hypothetical protein